MKSKVMLTCLLISSALLVGCSQNVTVETPNTPDNTNGNSSLPVKPTAPEKPSAPSTPSIPPNPEIIKPVKDGTVVDNSEKLSVSSFFPIKENTRYIYEGAGNEFASYNVYTSYTKNKA